ncbi:MAG: hypothetical protein PHP37_03300 [Patescibacteria group bacterium]|nr:hypothetical protein [Patescibacteria group bacterium]
MKKNTLSDLCLVPNPGPGPAEVEAIFCHNLVNIDGTWYCDVLLTDSQISNARLITVRYEDVFFSKDNDRKKWAYLLDLEEKEARKELSRERIDLIDFRQKLARSMEHRKIIAEAGRLCSN